MKGVLFDLDGVITDTAELHFKAWSNLAKDEIGINLPKSFEDDLKGISRYDSLHRILKFANKTNDFTEDQIDTMLKDKNDYYLKEIDKLTPKNISPGIEHLLNQLSTNGILLSIASASKNAPVVLQKIGLIDKFDAIADPTKVQHGKPAPDIFLEAARQINLKPEECVGLEDAPAGVESIKSANSIAIGIGDSQVLEAADKVVPDTSYLSQSLLENVFSRSN